jgi:Ca2+-binding RTX toxin-like protein
VNLLLDWPAPNGAYSLSRQGIQIGWLNGGPGAAFTACGAATVFNTDRIRVVGTPNDDDFVVDLSNGPFAPGATPEPGSIPEIEIGVDLGAPAFRDEVEIFGSANPDAVLGGQNGPTTQITLNGDFDADLALPRVPGLLTLDGQGGNDVLGMGGVQLGIAPYTGRTDMDGGEGDDELLGGQGNDRMTGGPGLDFFTAGFGNDRIDSRDGIAETVDTGGGTDRTVSDPFDTVI